MRKSLRWSICLAVVFAVGLATFANAAPAKITLNFIGMDQAGMTVDEQKTVIREFEELHPNVKVNTTFVSYDALHDKLVTALAGGGRAFDVMLVDNTWLAELASAGWLLDVTDRVTPEMKKATVDQEVTWRIVTYNGKLYGMPWLMDQKYFFYNEEMLARAGYNVPPKTWEQLVEMSRVMKKKGIVEYPIIWSWAQRECANCDFVALLYGFGGRLENEKGQPAFNEEGGLKALTFMVDTIREGISNPSSVVAVEEDVRHTLSSGKAAFAINWLYVYDLANDPAESQVAGNIKMSLVPVSEKVYNKGIVSATSNDSMGFAISKGSRNPDAAWELLKYFTSPEVMNRYAAHQLPIWKDSFSDPALLKDQPVTMRMFQEQFPYGHVKVHVPYYMQYSKIMQLMLQEALTGKKDPQRALDDAVRNIEAIQRKYR